MDAAGQAEGRCNAVTSGELLGGGADLPYEIVLDAPPRDGAYAFTVKPDGVRACSRDRLC